MVCWNCKETISGGHTFCGQCGLSAQAPAKRTDTQPFSALLRPGQARLTVIKGGPSVYEGMTIHLGAAQHPVGREEGVVIFEDPFLDALHANFYYHENQTLYIKDEESLNGCYLRIDGPVRLRSQDRIMVGQQFFQFDYLEISERYGSTDGTLAYVSPQIPYRFRLVQIFEDGELGEVYTTSQDELTIGRTGGDKTFAGDGHMSNEHARISRDDEGFTLEDLGSTNGTYIRLREATRLKHGDCLVMGQQLLRIDFS